MTKDKVKKILDKIIQEIICFEEKKGACAGEHPDIQHTYDETDTNFLTPTKDIMLKIHGTKRERNDSIDTCSPDSPKRFCLHN